MVKIGASVKGSREPGVDTADSDRVAGRQAGRERIGSGAREIR